MVIGGYSLNQANTTAHAEAIGIDGGDEDDALLNADAGSIVIAADAQVFSKSLTISVLGDASGEANTTAESTATGLRGGTGDDAIANRRDVTVSATASGNSAGASIGLIWQHAGQRRQHGGRGGHRDRRRRRRGRDR